MGFTYNSAARINGLVGDYYANPGTGVFPTTPPTMSRRDPNVAFYWGPDSPPSPTVASGNYMVRWTGNLTTPANLTNPPDPTTDSYTFFVATQGGVRMWVGNVLVMDNWLDSGAGSRADFASPVILGRGATVPIRFEYLESAGDASLALAVTAPIGAGGVLQSIIVPPSWLTAPALGPLPAGWTLSGGSALAYTSAHIFEHGATLTDAAGGLHTYRANASGGYTPPLDEDGVLGRDADGLLSLTATDGITYVFDASGRLTHTSAATDDDTKASADYIWSSDPAKVPRLLRIDDPVGLRQLRLDYGGYDAARPCPAVPAGQNLAAAPPDKLCQVENWDGTFTRLWYNAAQQLVRISEDPSAATLDAMASVTDYAYGSNAKLSKVRDPLANDAVKATAATFVPDDDTSRTLITYDSVGRVDYVTLPVPYDGLSATTRPRPGRGYEYPSATETWVHVDGLTGATDEPAGYHRKVIYDLAGRVTTDADATARSTTATWYEGDRLATRTDGAGRSTTTIYDGDATRAHPTGRVTDTYGPAPFTCFGSSGVPNGSCAVPPPHTGIELDTESATPATGLAMSAWANTGWRGAPKLRSQAAPNGSGVLVAANPAGLPAGAWSARYTGEITLAATGAYGFGLSAVGSARLYIDDTLVADTAVGAGAGTWTNALVGRHRIRIDFAATASPSLTLSWTPPSGSSQALGAAVLAPRFANPTRTTTDDDSGVASRVSAAVYESMPRGTVKEEIVDPGAAPHLNLVTTTAYETGGLGRPVSRTLPGGDTTNANTATSYAYYGNTQASPAVCGRAAGVNQAGRLRTTTGPSPDGTTAGRRASEVVYDVAGRLVASRVNAEDWSCRAYDTRGRLTQSTIPAYGGEPGHIFDYNYAVGTAPNPLITSVSEGTSVITTRVDLLGRVLSYTDTWAKVTTSTSTYDQAGRRTATTGPAGLWEVTYDPAGRVMTQKLDGALMATAAYHATTGELTSASYAAVLNGGNGTKLSAVGRHPSGMTTGLTWETTAGGPIAADAVQRSQSGKVIDQTIDGTDADAASRNFFYDAAGRLTQARVPGQVLDYGFGANGAPCAFASASAGRSTNRSSVALNGATPTTYCYDRADKLVSSTDTAVGTPVYDSHGNTTTLGTQTLIYDGADRHMETKVAGATLVRYERDATGRITSRKEGTAAAVRYGSAGPGDSPSFVMDAANTVIERTIALVGGVMVTKRGGLLGAGDVWSYPNVHGDVMAVADNNGAKQGTTRTYDPFGVSLGALPDNSAGNFDYAWLGQHQRPIEHAGTLATIEMGARQYVPSIGRFLEVDPVEGGSANDYVYCAGDPVNCTDLSGLADNNKHKRKVRDGLKKQVREHEEKIRNELKKDPRDQDQGYLEHWRKEIAGWLPQIDKLNSELPKGGNAFSRFAGRIGREAQEFGEALVNLPSLLESSDCAGGIACTR